MKLIKAGRKRRDAYYKHTGTVTDNAPNEVTYDLPAAVTLL